MHKAAPIFFFELVFFKACYKLNYLLALLNGCKLELHSAINLIYQDTRQSLKVVTPRIEILEAGKIFLG